MKMRLGVDLIFIKQSYQQIMLILEGMLKKSVPETWQAKEKILVLKID